MITRKQSYLVSLDHERIRTKEKKMFYENENETKDRLIQGTRSTQKTARLTNTKTNMVRGIMQDIGEERNLSSNREYVIAIVMD